MMQFGAPAYFACLLTLAVPFLLLLTRARTRRVLPFSSLAFLRQLTVHASRAIEWKRLMLLLTRLAFLACLALAFTLPFLIGNARRSARGKGGAVGVYLDTSYPMGYREGRRTLLARGRRAAEAFLKEWASGGEEPELYSVNEHVTRLARLEEARLTEYGLAPAVLAQALRSWQDRAEKEPVSLLIVSRFPGAAVSWKPVLQELERLHRRGARVRIAVERPRTYRNGWIGEAGFPERPLLAGQEETLHVRAACQGLAQPPGVRVLANGRELGRAVLDETGAAAVAVRFAERGTVRLKVELDRDALAADNARYFVADVYDPLSVLLADTQERAYPFESPFYFLKAALEGASKRQVPWLSVSETSARAISDAILQDVGVVVVAGTDIQEEAVAALERYVRNGGALLWILAPRGLEPKLSPALTLLWGGRTGTLTAARGPEGFRLDPLPYEHSLLAVFDGGRQGDLSEITFRRAAGFLAAPESGARTLLAFDRERPALLERALGKGKVLVWTSSFDAEGGELPKHPLFVPFACELLKYASGRVAAPRPGAWVGQPFILPRVGQPYRAMVVSPRGLKAALGSADGEAVTFGATSASGFYEWMRASSGDLEREPFAVNVRTELSADEPLAASLARFQSHDPSALALARQDRARAFYLYLPCLWAAFALAWGEALLANALYRPRMLP